MTLSIALILGILIIAFILFLTGWLKPDVIAMLVLLSLVILGIIEPIDAFQGFSSFAVMAIAGLLIIGEGLERTGVVKWVARKLEGLTGKSFNRLLLINTSIPGILSGFVNMVAAASFFIPVILRLCLKLDVSPSKVLIAMDCLALSGAKLSLIGASHNLVVDSHLEESQGVGFSFFEFTVLGAFSDQKLKEGDGLLFYGARDKIKDFDAEKEILVYHKPDQPEVSSSLKKKAPLAALILLAVVGAAATNLIPISVSALAGAVLMVLTGIINPLKTYDAIDWKTLVLIGGMYPLGLAVSETGASDLIGNALIDSLGGFGPLVVLAGIVVLTMVLTQPIHNAAVAIIMTPIAINAAELMGSNPRAFCVAVLVACSTTFLMPFGHPAPLMVQEPGKYNGADYIRFGLPLNILALAVILIVVPLIWNL